MIAGVAKLRVPDSASSTLAALGIPSSDIAAQAVGAIEILVGGAALAAPERLPFAALALAYAVLAAVVGVLLMRGRSAADCGCFGTAGGPGDRAHLLANVLFASMAGALAWISPPALGAATLGLPGLALAAGICAGGLLARALLTLLPSAWSAYGGQP